MCSVLIKHCPWWRHQIETFSALLALSDGNSPMTGEFPTQRASNAGNVSIWWRHHELMIPSSLRIYPSKWCWRVLFSCSRCIDMKVFWVHHVLDKKNVNSKYPTFICVILNDTQVKHSQTHGKHTIIIIQSEVWTITHCLGLGHETMVCAVCLYILMRSTSAQS